MRSYIGAAFMTGFLRATHPLSKQPFPAPDKGASAACGYGRAEAYSVPQRYSPRNRQLEVARASRRPASLDTAESVNGERRVASHALSARDIKRDLESGVPRGDFN